MRPEFPDVGVGLIGSKQVKRLSWQGHIVNCEFIVNQ